MANILVWYHDGTKIDNNSQPTPIVNEPSLSGTATNGQAEVYAGSPITTTAAPNATSFAWIETDADVRYRVNSPAPAVQVAATVLHKKIAAGEGAIALRPGQTISFIDA